MIPSRSLSLAIIAAALAVAARGSAQISNMDVNSDLPYSFLSPGARAAGMGGAFAALADDASAAFANPAGLAQLDRPEAAVEVRHQSFETPIADGPGRYRVDRHGALTTPPPYERFGSETTGLSYAAYTHPGPAWSFAFFGSEVSRFALEARTERVDGTAFREIAPRAIHADLAIDVYGAAAAWRATRRISLGVAATIQTLDYEAHQLDLRDVDLEWGQRASAEDTAASATVGVLWRPADSWRVGAAFRGGAEFDAEYSFTCGTRPTGARPAACHAERVRDGAPVPSLSGATRFKVPDVWSAGVAWTPIESLTAAIEVDRTEYSQMLDGLRNSLTIATARDHYSLDDADDLHLGLEWRPRLPRLPSLPGAHASRALALRAGAWLESAHSLRYTADTDEAYYRQEVAVALFSTPIDDEWHATAGVGFATGRWQVDLAADLSEYRDAFVLSTRARF